MHYEPFVPLDLNNDEEVDREIGHAINHMDKTKSAGPDGFARGHPLKGGFLRNDISLIQQASRMRLKRLALVGKDIGLFDGMELIRFGLRGMVFPAIKDEWHDERKIFQMNFDKTAKLDEAFQG